MCLNFNAVLTGIEQQFKNCNALVTLDYLPKKKKYEVLVWVNPEAFPAVGIFLELLYGEFAKVILYWGVTPVQFTFYFDNYEDVNVIWEMAEDLNARP